MPVENSLKNLKPAQPGEQRRKGKYLSDTPRDKVWSTKLTDSEFKELENMVKDFRNRREFLLAIASSHKDSPRP